MKDSFIIFTESRELIDECLTTPEQKAALLDALFAYACGEPVELDPTTKAVFISMRQKIDAASQKYEEKCQANRENGMKGGRPKKTEGLSEETEKTERFSEKPNGFEKTLPDTDTDPDTDSDKEKAPCGGQREKRFVPPTVEEVAAYCRERGNHVDPEQFVAFYESKGWRVGSQPMKNWRAAIRGTWEKDERKRKPPDKPPDGPDRDEQMKEIWLREYRKRHEIDDSA